MLKLNERILRKRKTYMNNFSESVLALKKRNIVNTIKELAHEINLSCLVTQHMMQWVDIFSTNYLIFDWFFCVFFTCRNWEDRKFTDDQRNPVQKGISRCLKLVKFLKYVIQLKKCFLKLLRFIFCKNWYNPIFFSERRLMIRLINSLKFKKGLVHCHRFLVFSLKVRMIRMQRLLIQVPRNQKSLKLPLLWKRELKLIMVQHLKAIWEICANKFQSLFILSPN